MQVIVSLAICPRLRQNKSLIHSLTHSLWSLTPGSQFCFASDLFVCGDDLRCLFGFKLVSYICWTYYDLVQQCWRYSQIKRCTCASFLLRASAMWRLSSVSAPWQNVLQYVEDYDVSPCQESGLMLKLQTEIFKLPVKGIVPLNIKVSGIIR